MFTQNWPKILEAWNYQKNSSSFLKITSGIPTYSEELILPFWYNLIEEITHILWYVQNGIQLKPFNVTTNNIIYHLGTVHSTYSIIKIDLKLITLFYFPNGVLMREVLYMFATATKELNVISISRCCWSFTIRVTGKLPSSCILERRRVHQ